MDIYNLLRPNTQIEACECERIRGILLVDLLSDNPIHCIDCRNEVDPARIDLTAAETEEIVRWKSNASALYKLWLDSGEYEAYAKERLIDPEGQVNQCGLEIARTLSQKLPTWLWFFHDTDDGEPIVCPICDNPLDTDVPWGTGRCDGCRLYI